jgi:NAD(P)-dependent dehydrogenase (short-subunit alcohol dehydrogenase family)
MAQDPTATDRSAEVLGRLFDVRGARTLVTGAASGLGFAFAEVLADCGARVTLADIDAELLQESTAKLADRGLDVRSVVVDVSDRQAVQAAVDEIVAEQGGLDVAFANAGIGTGPGFIVPDGETVDRIDPATFDRAMAINLNGALATIGAAAGAMKAGGDGGRIIVTSSIAGLQAEPIVGYAYVASKAALVNVVRQAALDLAPDNILINAICPGPVKNTRIGEGATLDPTPEAEAAWTGMVPLKRMGVPEELKGLALLLASPAGSFMTGAAYPVDGGSLL